VLILMTAVPPVFIVVFSSQLWEYADRGFCGGFVNSGKELTGFLCSRFVPWTTRVTQKFNERFVKDPNDAFMVNCMFYDGLLVPLMFLGCAWHVYHHGVILWIAFVYHLLRIGPYFMNFAYVYTLCHKEGHSRLGLFKQPYNSLLRHTFNWWVGLFYGVIPASFAFGHSINHHRYNNGPCDVISTADKPRDSFANWVAYLPRFFAYALNFSTILQFARERNWKVVSNVSLGLFYFFFWLALWSWCLGPIFMVTYVAYPFFGGWVSAGSGQLELALHD